MYYTGYLVFDSIITFLVYIAILSYECLILKKIKLANAINYILATFFCTVHTQERLYPCCWAECKALSALDRRLAKVVSA